ncbi:MAG: glycosyltransferase family 4 protein [Lachnospira sp.]
MIKMAVDVRSLSVAPGGIGMYTYGFVKALLKNHADVQMTLFTDVSESEHISELKGLGACIESYGRRVSGNLWLPGYHIFMRKKIKAIQPDIFWEPNMIIPPGINKAGCKTVISVHDMVTEQMPACYGFKYHLYVRFGLKYSLKKSDMVIYNSLETKIKTEKYFPIAKRIKYDISYIICGDTEVENDTTVDADSISCGQGDYFLYIGNMEWRKGVDILVRAYEKYCSQGGSCPLILAGKITDDRTGRLVREAAERNKKITYLDYVSESEKNALYSNCRAFVFPSRLEGFGIPVVEAILHGKPVIIGDNTIYDEILFNNIGVDKDSVEGLIRYGMTGRTMGQQINNLGEKMHFAEAAQEIKKSYIEKLKDCYSEKTLDGRLYGILQGLL